MFIDCAGRAVPRTDPEVARIISLVDKDIKLLVITLLHMTFRRKRKGAHVEQRDGTCIMTQIKLDMKKNVGEEKHYGWG